MKTAFALYFGVMAVITVAHFSCAAPQKKPDVECGCELGNGRSSLDSLERTDWVSRKSTGETIWTVGYYRRDGSWYGEQDFDNWEESYLRAKELNRRRSVR